MTTLIICRDWKLQIPFEFPFMSQLLYYKDYFSTIIAIVYCPASNLNLVSMVVNAEPLNCMDLSASIGNFFNPYYFSGPMFWVRYLYLNYFKIPSVGIKLVSTIEDAKG